MKDKDIEGKINELAQMVAHGFMELKQEMATKTDLEELRHELKGDIQEVRDDMATKEDLKRLKGDFDIMLDKHIGIFRKDFDDLARRTKDLEVAVFK